MWLASQKNEQQFSRLCRIRDSEDRVRNIVIRRNPMRFFTTAGPVNPVDHYSLNPLQRIDLENLLPLIEQKK